MKDKKEKKKCGFCEMKKKMNENFRESYARVGNIEDYLKEINFSFNKPFKIKFNEGISISFKNKKLLDEETMKKDNKKKEVPTNPEQKKEAQKRAIRAMLLAKKATKK